MLSVPTCQAELSPRRRLCAQIADTPSALVSELLTRIAFLGRSRNNLRLTACRVEPLVIDHLNLLVHNQR